MSKEKDDTQPNAAEVKRKEVAGRLNALRKEKGYSYHDLSEEFGISLGAIGNIFVGNHGLSDKNLVRISNFFNVAPKLIDPDYVQPGIIVGEVEVIGVEKASIVFK